MTEPKPKAAEAKPLAVQPSQQDSQAVDDSHMEAAPSAAVQPNVDEGEEILFAEKAILYRFDQANKDWKERGVGEMKILKKSATGHCRILMRRSQTFRVCANHYILPTMMLKPNSGSDRAFIWSAADFADGNESLDILSVRFRTAEIAQKFQKVFTEAQAINAKLLGVGGAKPAEAPKPSEAPKPTESK